MDVPFPAPRALLLAPPAAASTVALALTFCACLRSGLKKSVLTSEDIASENELAARRKAVFQSAMSG